MPQMSAQGQQPMPQAMPTMHSGKPMHNTMQQHPQSQPMGGAGMQQPTQQGKIRSQPMNGLQQPIMRSPMGGVQSPSAQGFQGASSAPYNPNQGGFPQQTPGQVPTSPVLARTEMTSPGASAFGNAGTPGTKLV